MGRHRDRRTSFQALPAPAGGRALCDINITPLIDVMLVLLVTLVVTLPLTTHAVKLDMPRPSTSTRETPPEVIDLDIEFDGRVIWNGKAIGSWEQLESYFHAAAGKIPQPEVHVDVDRHVKYDYVAQVLASAQRSHVERIGFVNTGDFNN